MVTLPLNYYTACIYKSHKKAYHYKTNFAQFGNYLSYFLKENYEKGKKNIVMHK